jgi:hypothetical protein
MEDQDRARKGQPCSDFTGPLTMISSIRTFFSHFPPSPKSINDLWRSERELVKPHAAAAEAFASLPRDLQ